MTRQERKHIKKEKEVENEEKTCKRSPVKEFA